MQEVLTLLDLAMAALREKKEIFSRLEREPELILTDLFDPSLTHPYYEFPFRAVEHSKELGSPQIDYHQLQEQLADMVANLFAGMDPEIEISLKNKHYYPSPCIIRYHGYPIVEFDFYRHTFTDLLKGYAATLKREAEKAAKREKDCKEEYAAWAHRCAEPSTMLRNASWWDRLLFFLQKKSSWPRHDSRPKPPATISNGHDKKLPARRPAGRTI